MHVGIFLRSFHSRTAHISLTIFSAAAKLARVGAVQGGARRGWGALAVAMERAMSGAVLGVRTMPPLPGAAVDVLLADVLSLAADTAPCRLPRR